MFHSIPLACLARELLSMQGRLIYNKQRHLLKQNLSETITLVDNSCMLSFNPSVDPVVCWYYFLMLVLIIVKDYYFWNQMHIVPYWQGMPLGRWGEVRCRARAFRPPPLAMPLASNCTKFINLNTHKEVFKNDIYVCTEKILSVLFCDMSSYLLKRHFCLKKW